jgi:DNA-binding transcriptional LysR family regulator
MDQKRIQYFVTLAKHLHYGAAAEELNIAQSALSRQINVLEEELGCQLFDRSNRWNVSLTAAGTSFFVEAQKILMQLENAKRLASSAARGEAGTLLRSFQGADPFRKRYLL